MQNRIQLLHNINATRSPVEFAIQDSDRNVFRIRLLSEMIPDLTMLEPCRLRNHQPSKGHWYGVLSHYHVLDLTRRGVVYEQFLREMNNFDWT